MSIYRNFDYEHRKRHLLLFMVIYDMSGNRERFYLMEESHSLSFHSARCGVSLLNHTERHEFTLFYRDPGPSFHSRTSPKPKFTVQDSCILPHSPLRVSPSPAVPDTHSKHPGPRKADIFTKLC